MLRHVCFTFFFVFYLSKSVTTTTTKLGELMIKKTLLSFEERLMKKKFVFI